MARRIGSILIVKYRRKFRRYLACQVAASHVSITPPATRNPREGNMPKPATAGMKQKRRLEPGRGPWATMGWVSIVAILCLPMVALAQTSPFMTGASALQTNILAWLTPVAVILVMVLGAMAMANRISWGWCIAAILGIAISFGAPQIVSWVRGMFGV
jgi:type IV secretion system protein VirB2